MIATHLHGARVLIGEHDPTMRSRLHHTLGSYGAEVAEAATGRELMTLLVEQGPFDAVITDSTMPSPPCPDVIAMTRSAGLEVAFLVITHSSDRRSIRPQRYVSLLAEPVDEHVVAIELDRILATPHALDTAKCVFVACSACGRPHIAELWPPSPSFCMRCIEATENPEAAYIDYGGGD